MRGGRRSWAFKGWLKYMALGLEARIAWRLDLIILVSLPVMIDTYTAKLSVKFMDDT
jgi:hypothetical protein